MEARITRSFRIKDGEDSRKFTPGEVATGDHANWAVTNGYGEEIPAKSAATPTNKAKPAPTNKSKPSSKSKRSSKSKAD